MQWNKIAWTAAAVSTAIALSAGCGSTAESFNAGPPASVEKAPFSAADAGPLSESAVWVGGSTRLLVAGGWSTPPSGGSPMRRDQRAFVWDQTSGWSGLPSLPPDLMVVGGASVGDDFTLVAKDCSQALKDGAVDEEGCGRIVLLALQKDSTWSESAVPDDVFPAVAQIGFVGSVGDSRIAVASASAKWVSVFDTVKRSWQRFDGPEIKDRAIAGSCSTRGHLFVVFAPMAGPVSQSAGETDVMVFREMTAKGDWSPQVEVERTPSAQQPAPGVACGGGAWTLPVGTNRWATITSGAPGEALTARSKEADYNVPNPIGAREGAVLLTPDAI